MAYKIFALLLIIASMAHVLNGQTHTGPKHGRVVVCYLTSWSIYREDRAKFKVTDVDPTLCTHLVYSFAGLDEDTNTIKSLDPGLDLDGKFENAGYRGAVALKTQYPHLKVTIAIGGWNEGSLKFSNMAASAESRAKFVQSVVDFLDTYGFDGIDMHWKFPSLRDGKPFDRANYVTLIKELYEAFKPRGYILASIVGPLKFSNDAAYDISELIKYVDLFHLLAYDYHGTWDKIVGVNAPLNGVNKDDVFSVESTIKNMLSRGVNPKKLVLGLPFFGRTFILENPDEENVELGRTAAKTEGFTGPYTNENGFMAYNEICMELTENDDKWTRYWHEQSSTPYLRNGDRIITYDNARSLAIKVKKAMEYNLGGVLVWSVDFDDFNGVCDRDIDYISVSFSALHSFVEKFNRITRNPILQRLLKDLNLPDAQKLGSLSTKSEVAHKNHLWTTDSTPNYPLLRAVDESITLALEEKLIMVDMMDMMNEKPEPGTSPAVTTNSLFTVVCYFCFI